jgi:hypothetical protein
MDRRLMPLVAVAVALLAGCVTGPPPFAAMQAEVRDYKLPAGPYADYATIYVLRPTNMAFAIRFDVYVDQKIDKYFVGSTKGNQYIYFAVAPGTRTILSQAENLASCAIAAEKGKVYFVQQTPKMGILYARNDLSAVNETEGKYWVKRLAKGSMDRKK